MEKRVWAVCAREFELDHWERGDFAAGFCGVGAVLGL